MWIAKKVTLRQTSDFVVNPLRKKVGKECNVQTKNLNKMSQSYTKTFSITQKIKLIIYIPVTPNAFKRQCVVVGLVGLLFFFSFLPKSVMYQQEQLHSSHCLALVQHLRFLINILKVLTFWPVLHFFFWTCLIWHWVQFLLEDFRAKIKQTLDK